MPIVKRTSWSSVRRLVVIGVLLALGVNVPASSSSLQPTVEVGFSFSAAGQDLPPGSYRVSMAKDREGHVELVFVGKGKETRIPVLTRLAALGQTSNSIRLVFDNSGGRHVLSEVWLPAFDGFLVGASKEEHEHEVVDDRSGD